VVTVETPPSVLRTVDEAVEHVHAICFKTGPPRRVGAELEWTVQPVDDPHRSLDITTLSAALGDHAPRTIDPDSLHRPLPGGGRVTIEPGGQVEISTPPSESLAQLQSAVDADITYLTGLLSEHGLRLGAHGIDPHRPPRRLLHTRRYDAMAASFARRGSAGQVMMCGTAAIQVCLDAGQPARVGARWAALHALGPPLLALFANSRRHAGRDTGWASARMKAWLAIDPARTWPVGDRLGDGDPTSAWAEYALAAPLLCMRRGAGRSWHPPPDVSFADWIAGKASPPPTIEDLDYHLGTLFPPVRPRGYVEVRYLDAQPPEQWIAPVAVLTALLSDDATTDAARDVAAGVADAWTVAAQRGLSDRAVRRAATALGDLACRALDRTDLTPATAEKVVEIVDRRLAGGQE
jgi:glutamate--cysteine ligase